MGTSRIDRTDTLCEASRFPVMLYAVGRPSGVAINGERQGSSGDIEVDTSNGQDNRLNLSVRTVRLSDLYQLARMPVAYRLNQPEINLRGFSCAPCAFKSVVPGGKSRPKMFVALADDRLIGFAQFQEAFSDRRWHAMAIGTSTGVFDAAPVEDAMLRHAITAAGLRGVKRLYARVPSGTDLLQSFAAVGFAPFATETVFACDRVEVGGEFVAMRPQEQSDTWAIHQLYNATVARQVQYAEALTSHRWDVSGHDELAHSGRRFGWLVDDGQGLAAYARVSCAGGTHMIELLYVPERTEVLGGLIDSVVTKLKSMTRVQRVYCALRGYQAEAAKVLEARGFEVILEQDLLVKYTTATARAPQPEPAQLHAEVIERLPKRAPSFLNQSKSRGGA